MLCELNVMVLHEGHKLEVRSYKTQEKLHFLHRKENLNVFWEIKKINTFHYSLGI